MSPNREHSLRKWRLTLVVAALTIAVLLLSVPASLQHARNHGGFYLFSREFIEDIPKRLRIVAARPGERLESLGARSGNVWSPAYTALVNGLIADSNLDESRLGKDCPGGAMDSADWKQLVSQCHGD